MGTVAYAAPGTRPVAASGVRVIAVGGYSQSETRTDNNGSFVLVLRPGSYRVVAQGALGYVQYQNVTGYVSANTNSYINPNPLFLVPARRSSNSALDIPYSQVITWSESAIVTHEITAENNDTVDMGDLSGSVMYKQGNQPAIPARQVLVTAKGPHRTRPVWTDENGDFLIKSLPAGEYSISVQVLNHPRYQPETVVKGYVKSGSKSMVSPNPILLVLK
jgi:hypothetical protein